MTNVTTSDSASLGFVQVPIVGSNLYPPEAQATEVVRYDQFVLQITPGDTREKMIAAAVGTIVFWGSLLGDPLYQARHVEMLGHIRQALQVVQNCLGIPEQEILQANALIHAERYISLKHGTS